MLEYKLEYKDEEVIIAQCTPTGKGALALLRLTGNQVRTLVAKFAKLPSSKNIKLVPSHTVHFGWILDQSNDIIDHVMFIVMDGPKTFTGQNTIEITCHNNPFVIDIIINIAITLGARIAASGEFTKRAFLNNKIDLVQAEAINELIHANTQIGLKKSLAQLEGSFSHHIASIEKELLRAFAWCQASFEFLDEEIEFGENIKRHLQLLHNNLQELKKTFDIQQTIRQGIRIAIIGSVNTGKSSLFNIVLSQNRSIVTNIAGTTRDVIEAGIYRNNNYWTLVDTAGLRQTKDIIEQEGIKRSFAEAHKADIILLIIDGSRVITPEEYTIYQDLLIAWPNKIITVHNKSDLPTEPNNILLEQAMIKISYKHTTQELEDLIEQKVESLLSNLDSPFLLNKRQTKILLALEQKLEHIIAMLNDKVNYELVSYHLQDALEHLSELTGKSISQAGMDMVFKEFCVGK